MRDILLCSALFGGALFAMWLPLGLVWAEGAAIAALVSVPITAFVAAAYAPRFAADARRAQVRTRGERAQRPGDSGGAWIVSAAYALSVAVLAIAWSRPFSGDVLVEVLGAYVMLLLVGMVVLAPALPIGVYVGRFYASRVQYAQTPEPRTSTRAITVGRARDERVSDVPALDGFEYRHVERQGEDQEHGARSENEPDNRPAR